MTHPNVSTLKVKATGSLTARAIGDRYGEIVNVKDFGTRGDGTGDDRVPVQAALDAAFGSSVSPHGSANAYQNRPVWFPAGAYNIGSPGLNLTKVVGGKIFGSGALCTRIQSVGATTLFNVNGMANCILDSFNLATGFGARTVINLDWDGTSGGDGLNGNEFSNLIIEGDFTNSGSFGIIIADSGHDGAKNAFLNVSFSNGVGLDVRGAAALGQVVVSGGGAGAPVYKIGNGSISSILGISVEGTTSGYGIEVTANASVIIAGVRTESTNILTMSAGRVKMGACSSYVPDITANNFANLTGGKLSLDACSGAALCAMVGNGGKLYLRGCNFQSHFLDAYSGTVGENI